MKKIYFAGKFNLDPDESLPLSARLGADFRALVLRSPERLVLASDGVMLTENALYAGPFYCEAASDGEYTSTDCRVVLEAERRAVLGSDVYVAVLGADFSVGTVVELGWALGADKEIFIIYKKEPSRYTIASEYWFAIADALARSQKVRVYPYESESELLDIIETEILKRK